MHVRFKATESVQILIEDEEIPIQHYLRQPQRLVEAIANPQLMQQLSEERYKLKMRPINFMEMYHFQPIVILKVWAGTKGMVYLKSEECEIRGVDYIDRRFSLQLKGILYPESDRETTSLQGQADLEVKVDLPPTLRLTPQPWLEMAGNTLLKSVLVRIKQRLVSQLLKDYRHWATKEAQQEREVSGTNLATDFGLT
jgi:hypothetical protein